MALFGKTQDHIAAEAEHRRELEQVKESLHLMTEAFEREFRAAVDLRSQVAGLERQTGHLLEALDRERTLLQRAMERNELLVDKIVEMKREGFVPAPFAGVGNLERLDINLDDQIMDAIGQRSMGDPTLERRLTKWALSVQREGNSPEQVAHRILVGGSPEEDEE